MENNLNYRISSRLLVRLLPYLVHLNKIPYNNLSYFITVLFACIKGYKGEIFLDKFPRYTEAEGNHPKDDPFARLHDVIATCHTAGNSSPVENIEKLIADAAAYVVGVYIKQYEQKYQRYPEPDLSQQELAFNRFMEEIIALGVDVDIKQIFSQQINFDENSTNLDEAPLWRKPPRGFKRTTQAFIKMLDQVDRSHLHDDEAFILNAVARLYESIIDSYYDDNIAYVATQTFHSDSPAYKDKLNRMKLIRCLAGNLSDTKNYQSRVIGLLGEWGSGKSSLLRILKNELKVMNTTQPFVFGEFNAWAYGHCDNIQAGIAQEVLSAVTTVEKYEYPTPEKSGTLIYYFYCMWAGILNFIWRPIKSIFLRSWITLWYSIQAQKLKILKSAFVLVVALVPVLLTSYELDEDSFPWLSGLSNDDSILGNLVFQLLWGVGFGIFFLKEIRSLMANPLSKELMTYIRLPDYAKHLGEIPVMRKNIKVMSEIRLWRLCRKHRRMLFVVDDLDRCGPDEIVKVLEAVRLVLDLENVIVVIAIDQNIALAALSHHFKEFSRHHKLKSSHTVAREYLSKVINLPIVLTKPSDFDVENYLNDIWSESIRELQSATDADDKSKENIKSTVSATGLSSTSDMSSQSAVTNTTHQGNQSDQSDRTVTVKAISKEQQDSFIYWVNYFGLANPRQLKRLNNSYDLMRSYFDVWDKKAVSFQLKDNEPLLVYPMMLTLILMEYINDLGDPCERRLLKKKLFFDNESHAYSNITIFSGAVFDNKVIDSAFVDAYRQLQKEPQYRNLAVNVEAFVLPAIDDFGDA
jgi:KAP family P-loop domain